MNSQSALNLRISMVDIDKLRAHEEVIEDVAERLAKQIVADGVVRDPLIVDQQKYVILDGMHRFCSLRLLKCRFAPCNLVDYDDPRIQVNCWFRAFLVKEPGPTAERLLRECGLVCSKEEFAPGQTKRNGQPIILTSEGTQFKLNEEYSAIEHARAAVRLEKELKSRGYKVDYLPEHIAIRKLMSADANLVISPPIFTKQQIREIALRGLLLPHKTTRHIVFSRPLHLNVPLQLLRENRLSESETDRKLQQLLSKSRAEKKPPGSVVDGRLYDEDLVVFSA